MNSKAEKMQNRLLWLLAILGLIILLWLSACQAATPASPAVFVTPAGTVTISVTRAPDSVIAAQAAGLPGKFVFARSNGALMLQDATGANLRALIPSNGETLAQFPAFSPDGTQVAYSFNYFNKDGLVVQDIRIINVDGTNAHMVVGPDDPKVAFDFPAWNPNGKELYFTQSYPIPPSSEHSEIDRMSVNGGTITKVIEPGRLAAISPDGKKMAFRRLDLTTYGSSLWVSDIDGTDAKQLVSQNDFFDIFAARFFPDSSMLVFAGSGEPKRKLPGLIADAEPIDNSSCAVSLLFLCVVERASAHGLPADLYTVDLAATHFERLTHAGADSPYPAFSPDQKYIGFLSEIGIFAVDRQQKNLFQVTSSGGYGGFDWGK